jgi:hypothetical protein
VAGVRRRGRVVLGAQKTGQKVRFWETMLTVAGGEIGNQWRRSGFELRSLAAFWLGFWRGTSAEEGGVYRREDLDEGQGTDLNSGEIRRRSPRCSSCSPRTPRTG